MNKKITSFILIFFILTITLGCGTENTNTQTDSANNTKEDIQEEIIPDKVYQDEEAKTLIAKAEEEIRKARKNYDFIKKDQDLLLKKLAPLESKIDIPTGNPSYTIKVLENMLPNIETMANNSDALSVSLDNYGNAIKYVNDAENLDISPEYRAYLTKYKEALIKEKNGVFYYQRAMYNKTRLLLANTFTAIYDIYWAFDNLSMRIETQRTAESNGVWIWKGLNVYEERFNWENDNVTKNFEIYEKSMNEAEKLFEEANKILPQ